MESTNPFASPQWTPEAAAESEPGAGLSPNARHIMSQTRPWVLLLAVLGFIATGLLVFLLLLSLAGMAGAGFGPGEVIQTVLNIAVNVVTFSLLLNYGVKLGRFVRSGTTADLAAALGAQRMYWIFIGVLIIVGLALLLILLIAGLFLAASF